MFIFNLLDIKVLFSENHIFPKQKRMAVYGGASLVPDFKLTCYLRDINIFLRYLTLCKNILKCGFPTRGIKLTRFVLFEVLGVLRIWGYLGLDHGYLGYLDNLVTLFICSQHRAFLLPWWYFPVQLGRFSQSEKLVLYYE